MKAIMFVSYHELNKQGSPMKWDYRCDDAPYDVNMSGTYVLASEAKAEVDNANADWIERCRKFRAQDAEEANERIKVLEDALPPPERLELLAEWFDKCYQGPNNEGTEVQSDLRTWAYRIRAALEVKT